MINPPSNQHPYDEFWSGDPAFEQEPAALSEDATEAQKATHKTLVDEYTRKLKVARQTGDWSLLRVAGAPDPTRFLVKPLPGHVVRWLNEQRGTIGIHRAAALAFRACIVRIDNPTIEVKPETVEHLGQIAELAVTNRLDAVNMSIVTEIGLALILRGTEGLSPKSSTG